MYSQLAFILAPGAGVEPATIRLHTTSAFAARSRGSWSGLSNHPRLASVGCRSSSLYTFPVLRLGLARDCQPSEWRGRVPRIWAMFTCRLPDEAAIDSRTLFH